MNTDVVEGLNALKRHIFFELLNLVGRVFIVVKYHKDVKIGKRGFLPEEKKNGIILVFNPKMNFQWHEWGIEARLVFDGSVEHCLIPVEHIIGVYSPDLNTQFLSLYTPEKSETKETTKVEKSEKVVRVDFRKRN